MPQQIQFTSGLPRSGSTLFQNILAQNGNHYCTPTSGLINFFMASKRGWKDNNEFRAEGLEKVQPRVRNSFKGMIEGYYHEELSSGKVVFDKSRGWLAYIEYMKDIFQDPDIKIICMIRDVRAIVASFEKLYRNRGIEYPEPLDEDFILSQTPEGRAEILLRPNGVVGMPILRLRDAARRHGNNLIFVKYHEMLSNPKDTFNEVHELLELPKFEYDFNQVKQHTNESDVYHGYNGLHDIKEGKLELPTSIPWEGIYNDDFLGSLSEIYNDINTLANS